MVLRVKDGGDIFCLFTGYMGVTKYDDTRGLSQDLSAPES